MINIAICDDDNDTSNLINKLITEIIHKNNYNMNVSLVTSSQEEIFNKISNKEIDVLFLDIKFKDNDNSGLDLAENLRKVNINFYLIFITGYLEYAILSFQHKTFDFIVKPVNVDKLDDTLSRLNDEINATQNSLVKFKNNIVINPNDILFIEKAGYKAIIHTKNDKAYTSYGTIKELTNILPNNFVQSHRAFIVNKKLINSVDNKKNLIYFEKDYRCPMSNSFKKHLM